jgi:hypothetical protein
LSLLFHQIWQSPFWNCTTAKSASAGVQTLRPSDTTASATYFIIGSCVASPLAIEQANEFSVSALHNGLLQCGIELIMVTKTTSQERCHMREVWDTKDGLRRVRHDPPTIDEAVVAAQGLTEDLSEQVEIVTSLMQISAENARGAVLRLARTKHIDRTMIASRSSRAGRSREVVVERRMPSRRMAGR